MKLSRSGKPVCSQCQRLAVALGNYHLRSGYLVSLAYCATHAEHVSDAIRLQVGYEIEPVLDTMLYWRLPITFEAVMLRVLDRPRTANPNPAAAGGVPNPTAKINPARFVGDPTFESARLAGHSKVSAAPQSHPAT